MAERPGGVPVGLCERCAHRRPVPNRRGSVFTLCLLWRVDERFPRYPRLPVRSCPGFRPLSEPSGPARPAR